MDKICVTRWTVRVECFRKIKENCQALLQLMRDSIEEKLDLETKPRIVGCKKQLKSFSFFFGLNLGQKLYAHTNNLSRTLQHFNLFYKTVKNQQVLSRIFQRPRSRESVSTPIIPSSSIMKPIQVLPGKLTIQKRPSIISNRFI